MIVDFILNGKKINLETRPSTRLINILRDNFHLTGAKCGCLGGICGACSVIFNGTVTPSCLIPAFRLKNCEVTTIENFSLSDSYKDIIQGFAISGVKNCGMCDTGKILTAEQILQTYFSKNNNTAEPETLSRSIVALAYQNVRCRCTVLSNLIDGVLTAAEIRNRRIKHE
jgi:carbon-monoxide dehydrogenase small subunit